jgi:hypothetical protein
MATSIRRIGLSLGADLCWPAAYETLMKRLDLDIELGGERIRFDVERVLVEPFDLAGRRNYDVVLDRVTHWFHTTREWIKKITLADGTYVLNNPWSIQANEKHASYVAMMRLGLPIPATWMIPPKEYETDGDWQVTVKRYNKLFDLGQVGAAVGYPAFLKPYDGGGWVGVRKVDDEAALRAAYDESGRRVHHLQAGVRDWDLFVRAIGVGPQVNVVKYDPDQPLHGRYVVDFGFIDGEGWRRASRICRTINAFFGWDFNSCEMLRSGGTLHPIDFANACPDSQVTSLHYHWPWLVKALVRWTVFCAATRRPFRLNLDWRTFFDARDPSLDLDAQLERYDAIAAAWFDTARFEEFCAKHLSHLDEVAIEVFSAPQMRDVVRSKVAALYPAHEVESFTDHFHGLVRFWCKTESDRIGLAPQ